MITKIYFGITKKRGKPIKRRIKTEKKEDERKKIKNL